jgi:hypothetical protein
VSKLEHQKKLQNMVAKTKEPEKKFDAIKIMREIRDKISLEIMNMTYAEERAYLDNLLLQGKIQAK